MKKIYSKPEVEVVELLNGAVFTDFEDGGDFDGPDVVESGA